MVEVGCGGVVFSCTGWVLEVESGFGTGFGVTSRDEVSPEPPTSFWDNNVLVRAWRGLGTGTSGGRWLGIGTLVTFFGWVGRSKNFATQESIGSRPPCPPF